MHICTTMISIHHPAQAFSHPFPHPHYPPPLLNTPLSNIMVSLPLPRGNLYKLYKCPQVQVPCIIMMLRGRWSKMMAVDLTSQASCPLQLHKGPNKELLSHPSPSSNSTSCWSTTTSPYQHLHTQCTLHQMKMTWKMQFLHLQTLGQ